MIILFFGDVYGKPGRLILQQHLPDLKLEHNADICIINGENLADGKGLTEKVVKPLWDCGVDVITGGNHLWDRVEAIEFIQKESRIVKPMNYPMAAPGHSVCKIDRGDVKLSVISFTGQIYMPPCDSPFTAFADFYNAQGESPEPLVIDFHAESTAEKRAFGWFVNGKASALLGTHTHIQTADEEILPEGTAYITDVGMTGPHDSVIGVRKNIIVEKNINAVPMRFETSDKGMQINAVVVDIDETSGFARSIQRIRRNVEIL